jgi:hypothetical protein
VGVRELTEDVADSVRRIEGVGFQDADRARGSDAILT